MIQIRCPKCNKATDLNIEERKDASYIICDYGCETEVEPETDLGAHSLFLGRNSYELRQHEPED